MKCIHPKNYLIRKCKNYLCNKKIFAYTRDLHGQSTPIGHLPTKILNLTKLTKCVCIQECTYMFTCTYTHTHTHTKSALIYSKNIYIDQKSSRKIHSIDTFLGTNPKLTKITSYENNLHYKNNNFLIQPPEEDVKCETRIIYKYMK